MARTPDIDGLRKTLLVYAAAGAFLIGIAAAALSVLPFSSRLHEAAADGVSDNARVAAQAIGALVSGRHQVVRLITSRTQARTLLSDFAAGDLDETTFRARTGAIMADAVDSAEDVTGVTRVVKDRPVKVAVGQEIDPASWPPGWETIDRVTAHGPIVTPEGARIVIASPIIDESGMRLGTDIVTMTATPVSDQLASRKAEAGGSTRVFLAFEAEGRLAFLLANGSILDQADVPGLSPALVRSVLNRPLGVVANLAHPDLIVSVAPVGFNGWAVLVKQEADEVFAGINEELALVAMAVLTLTLLGAAGIYLLLRPLTGNLLIHADALAEKVKVATNDAEQARDRAENARRMVESAYGELKRTQDTLIQAEKMASLGGLVAGVAHEINTPVGIVVTSATFLSAETEKLDRAYRGGDLSTEELEEYLSASSEAAQLITVNAMRAADLIHSFKQVAVDQTAGEQRTINLEAYVGEVLTSLKPNFKKRPITIDVNIPSSIEMHTFPGALSQILTNLAINSLTHGYAPDQPGRLAISAEERAGEVILRFADDGKGIPPEHRHKIFEPFFTTKRNAGGSGLGLHIIYNLVTRTLGGRVTLDAAETGCAFTIRIPKVAVHCIPAEQNF